MFDRWPERVERHLWLEIFPPDHWDRATMDRTELMKASHPLQYICCRVIYLFHHSMQENTFSNRDYQSL
jgi:hypothetical protein